MLMDPSMLEMLSSLRSPGEPDPLREILDVYREDGAQVLDRLQAAAEADDWDATRRAAHRLKGSSGNLGAVALSAVLAVIEREAPEGITPRIHEAVARARTLFDETVAAIEAHCG